MLLGGKKQCPSSGRQDTPTVNDSRDTGVTATSGVWPRVLVVNTGTGKGLGRGLKAVVAKTPPQLPGIEVHMHSSRMLRTGLQDNQLQKGRNSSPIAASPAPHY